MIKIEIYWVLKGAHFKSLYIKINKIINQSIKPNNKKIEY